MEVEPLRSEKSHAGVCQPRPLGDGGKNVVSDTIVEEAVVRVEEAELLILLSVPVAAGGADGARKVDDPFADVVEAQGLEAYSRVGVPWLGYDGGLWRSEGS